MIAAADSFLADAVVGFMKLSDADAVVLAAFTVDVDPVDGVDVRGRRGLDLAVVVVEAVMLGVDVADRLRRKKSPLNVVYKDHLNLVTRLKSAQVYKTLQTEILSLRKFLTSH